MKLLLLIATMVLGFACKTAAPKPIAARVRPALQISDEPPRWKTEGAVPGRYLGFVKLQNNEAKLPMTIDLVASSSGPSVLNFDAIVKYSLGDFTGNEFYAEFFADAVFDLASKNFVFPELPGKFRLTEVNLKAGAMIQGKIIGEDAKDVGSFMTVYTGKRNKQNFEKLLAMMYPEIPNAQPIAGKYGGTCDEKKTELSIQLARWSSTKQETNNLLQDYRVAATLAQEELGACKDASLCVRSQFNKAVMGFGDGLELFLKGSPTDRKCKVGNNALVCGECALKKDTEPAAATIENAASMIANRPKAVKLIDLSAAAPIGIRPQLIGTIEGEYFGYLFHEKTGLYQLMRLKVMGNSDRELGMEESSLSVSGAATLFFDEHPSEEFIVHKFPPRYYTETSPYFMFMGEGEGFLQVSNWREGMIRGLWYSKTSGRIGVVQLMRDRLPVHEQLAGKILGPINGNYQGSELLLTLMSQANISEYERDFFPLLVRGVAHKKSDLRNTRSIDAVSIDVNSGSFAAQVQGNRLAVGTLADSKLNLEWPQVLKFGNPVKKQKSDSFVYEKTAPDAINSALLIESAKSRLEDSPR